ncbi:CopG family ribbon-helix-helix protein [Halobacteriaceae archaeon GCM10025711]
MRTSLNVPESVLAEFDETWQVEGMDSRSRAVREAMQEYVESHARLEALTGDVAAVLAYDYDHDAVVDSLYDVQHDFEDVITATNHVHHGDWCLETVFCHGPAPRVRELVFRLRDFDAVARVKVLLLRPDDA